VTEVAFLYPKELRFTCSRCGDCCRQWLVSLAPHEAQRLESLTWDERDEDLRSVPVHRSVPGAESSGRRALAQRDDGACVFLGARNQCRIHERFGEEKKPLMCRLFPFGFLPVGDRVAVDVSYACRAVSLESGAPLEERVPEWQRQLNETPSGSDRHRFSKKYEIDGALLWELEHQLVEILSDRSLSFLERIRCLLEFHRLTTTSDPRTDAARTLRGVMAEGIPRQIRERPLEPGSGRMDKTGRAVFFHFLFLVLNPVPDRFFELSTKAREKQVRLRLQWADGYKFPDAHPLVDNEESGASFAETEGVSAEYLARGEGGELVTRYLRAKIVGQRFLREAEEGIPFAEAVPRLALAAAMVSFTAKAFAAGRRVSSVADEDVRRALRLVDRSFGQVRLSLLPPKQRKAWRFVLLETDLPLTANVEALVGSRR
jgi:Fe-S-cluster containining protein